MWKFNQQITVCCIDAENYSALPLAQFEEDNILRELNKSFLGFRQRRPAASPGDPPKFDLQDESETGPGMRRLSPIGESFSSASPEFEETARRDHKVLSSCTDDSLSKSFESSRIRGNGSSTRAGSPGRSKNSSTTNRNHFIVLGSSGEALPVTRKSLGQTSHYDSCSSQSTESFHSARETIEEEPGDLL